MELDHLIYADPDLDHAVARIDDLFGVRAGGGGRHEGQGTHNVAVALGPRAYLELIAPDPAQPEPAAPRPYGVHGVSRGGLVGWAVACEDIEAAVQRARRNGFDPGAVVSGQRRRPDGGVLRWRLSGNARVAGVVPFLIEWGDTPHPAGSAPRGLTLDAFHLEHPEPGTLRTVLAALGVEAEIREARWPALVARLTGPAGTHELR